MTSTLAITGMTCRNCVRHVEAALRALPGVSAVEVKLADHAASVVHDPERSPVATLVDAIVDAGYTAVPQ
ncbi:MAG: heavy metal-associated domain-containing protein [Kofleriaceae bacterium]